MPLSASAIDTQGCNADNYSAVDGVSDGIAPQSPSPASTPLSSSVSLTCPVCGQTFGRREHLSRHLDRHSGRRSYKCNICEAAFSRRDTLKRHVSTHGTAALAAWNRDNARFLRDTQRRACNSCARDKQRCDGHRPTPCTKCTKRGRRCVYEPISNNDELSLVEQPAADNDVSDAHSSASQHLQTLTPTSSVPIQPRLEPDLTWDTMLSSAQFLIPFSPVPSFEAGTLTHFGFGDALAAAGPPADDSNVQYSFGADTAQRGTAETAEAFEEQDSLPSEDEDILIAENIPHVPPVTTEMREFMIEAIKPGLPQHEAQELRANFPSLQHLDTYMQLYFEHFHPRMPVLHIPTFQPSSETWQLVLSVVCLGSRYSLARQHQNHVLLLQRLAQHMLKRDLRELSSLNLLISAQSHLLFQQSLAISGEWSAIIEAQFYRNILVTLCRLLLSREGTLMHSPTSAEDMNQAWFQWIKTESKRRVIHFTYISECLYATFLMLPPLLSAPELQVPVPSADSYWSSSCEQWHLLPPLQPSSNLCAHLSRVGLGEELPASLNQSAMSAVLFSASLQKAAESDFLRAIGLDSTCTTSSQPSPALSTVTTISQKTFDVLSSFGCSRMICDTDVGTSTNDLSLLSRILVILSFTPLPLLFSYNKWKTTDIGQSKAKSELFNIIPRNICKARHCLYYAAQVLQHFRITRPATVLDVMGALVSVLFIALYVDVVEEQDTNFATHDDSTKTSRFGIIRLDQVVDGDILNDWLQVRNHRKPHIVGVGFIHHRGSILRLYKEASRIMARGSSISRMAKVISDLFEMQAKGYPPIHSL